MRSGVDWVVRLLALSLLLAACSGAGSNDASAADALGQGKVLYEQNCAACHGINGEGQPNWKQPNANDVYPAPPHDGSGHTWHHADGLLLQIIADGGTMPKSQMLGFSERLTEEEMRLILDHIKTFWGEQEREFQEQVTQQFE